MPPRKPQTTITPTQTTPPTLTQNSPLGTLTSLPESFTVSLPDTASLAPTDWFKASSAPIPRTDDATYQEEMLTAHEQSNSLDILNANLENVVKLGQAAIKTAKVGKLQAEYLVALEEIRAVGVKLRGAQINTANEEIRVNINHERGKQLGLQLSGEQQKTLIQQKKNEIGALEVDYLDRVKPLKEMEWSAKLSALESKVKQIVDGE